MFPNFAHFFWYHPLAEILIDLGKVTFKWNRLVWLSLIFVVKNVFTFFLVFPDMTHCFCKECSKILGVLFVLKIHEYMHCRTFWSLFFQSWRLQQMDHLSLVRGA